MTWQACVTALETKWILGSVFGVLVLCLWLASLDGWAFAVVLCGAAATATMAMEPVYHTGNLLLYRDQYQVQAQTRTSGMDMNHKSTLEG